MVNVVLTGSVGHITKPLAKLLVKDGCTVSIITTNGARRSEIESLGAAALVGSIEDRAFLTDSFAGADVVYFMIPPSYLSIDKTRRVTENAADAVRASGVKSLIFLSCVGAHLSSGTGIILSFHHAEQVFSSLEGISLTIIRPGYFYHNLTEFYLPMIKANGFLGNNYGGNDSLGLVHHLDVAEVIAEEVLAPAESTTTTRVRFVFSDYHTCNETTALLGASINQPDLEWRTFTDEELGQRLAAVGLPPPDVAATVEFGAALHNKVYTFDCGDAPADALGKTKLKDFVRDEFVSAFNA